MYIGPNTWQSEYSAVVQKNTVEFILAKNFDDIFIDDLKNTFEKVVRVDSLNKLTAPFNFYNFRGINLIDPVLSTDAATKQYVDNKSAESAPKMFSFGWYDHLLTDSRYIRSDLFQWIVASQYQEPYNELLADYNAGEDKTEEIKEITITYRLSKKGRKIALATMESQIIELFDKTGVAWFYILDKDKQQFKLPRTKWGFVGLRNAVESYIEESLPNHTHGYQRWQQQGSNEGGRYYGVGTLVAAVTDKTGHPSYKDDAPVQQRATEMYLYFFLGGEASTTGYYRGSYATKADIPTDYNEYPADETGNKKPKSNDYLVVEKDESTNNGTWQYKYTGTWDSDGVNGWIAEKQIVPAVGPQGPQGEKGDPGDLTEVSHDETLTGKGTTEEPLGMNGEKIVDLSSAQTITGKKTFTQGVYAQGGTGMSLANSFSGAPTILAEAKDAAKNISVRIVAYYDASNTLILRMLINRNGQDDYFDFKKREDGRLGASFGGATKYLPGTSDNSSGLATTEWVNKKIQKVNVLPAEPDANVFYFIPEGA